MCHAVLWLLKMRRSWESSSTSSESGSSYQEEGNNCEYCGKVDTRQ